MKNKAEIKSLMTSFFILCLSLFLVAFPIKAVEAIVETPFMKAARSDPSVLELAKKADNPIADVEYIRLQYDTFKDGALGNDTMRIVTLQPAISTHLSKDWNLISRASVPLISAPTAEGRINGVGDTVVTLFFSPRNTGNIMWGIGPTMQFPTATKAVFGAKSFGIGPAAVIVKEDKQWLYGVKTTYMHSLGEEPNNIETNLLTIQPIINYRVPNRKGLSITFNPLISCDYSRKQGDQWLVPLGLQIGQVIKVKNQPISIDIGAYKNVTRTSSSPKWNYRLQLTFFLPK